MSEPPTPARDLAMPLSDMTNPAPAARPRHAHEPSPLESARFQDQFAVPLGATAIVLAAASLPLMYGLGRQRETSPTETAVTLEDAVAAEHAPAAQFGGSAAVDAPAAPTPASVAAAAATEGESHTASTLPPERRFSTMLSNAATAIWKQTDLYTGLHAGDDAAFRERMMHPPHDQMSLPQRKAQLTGWANEIARMALPDNLKQHFRDSIQDTISTIDGLIRNANPWSRTAKLVAQAILCTPLPIVLPLFAVPIERQQMDVIIASYVKTTMLRGGLAMRASANNAAITNLYLNRDYANVIQSLALSLNLFGRTRGVADNPAYSVGAAVASAAALAYTFYPDQVKSLPGHVVRTVKQVASLITRNGPLPPREQSVRVGGVDASGVSDESKAGLHALGGQVFQARASLASERHGFKDAGKTLSDTADWQFGQMLKGYHNLARDLEAFTASPGPANGSVHDPDRTAKLALAIMSGTICAGVTAEFYQNKITAVDMGVDALFNIYNGLNQALDPNVSWQQSLDTFKNWTSLSLVMAPMQAGNLLAGNPVERTDKNMLVGAGALTAANLLVAGPFGAAVKIVVGKALDLAQREMPAQATSLEMIASTQPADSRPHP
ncbi:hypothetical protein [Robbsia betulipollinis]|nr:hypothetical protein [Robbsia betulipollinis]